jgi:hypothetical protein
MSTGLIDIMKRASLDAIDNAQMCDLRFGKVVSINPLKVQVTNQFTIPEALLIVPQHLKDYTVSVSMNWDTTDVGNHTHDYSGTTENTSGGSDLSAFASHGHAYSGTTQGAGAHNHSVVSDGAKTITIHNALKVNDKVALIRKTGGQSYYILDRI